MNTLGLRDHERSAYVRALRSSHIKRITVTITDLQGKDISDLPVRPLDGQVTVDMDADVTRSASLSFFDPNRALNFDTDSPDDGALYADRMIRIRYGIYVDELNRWVDAPVFLGPITKLDRAGDVVSVEAQGKEVLASGDIWRPLTIKKGTRTTDAIRTLMISRAGENRASIPKGKGPKMSRRPLDRFTPIWDNAKRLAASMGRQLLYQADGTLVLRTMPPLKSPCYTFRTGDGGDIVGEVQVSYELTNLVNTVLVVGKAPEAKKKGTKSKAPQAPRASVTAPKNHPLSPWRLGRTGGPRYLAEKVEDNSLRSVKACRAHAKEILDARLAENVTVTFDALPIPHLEPGDAVAIKTDEFSARFRLRQFTIPLATEGAPAMTVGYLKHASPKKKRIRR